MMNTVKILCAWGMAAMLAATASAEEASAPINLEELQKLIFLLRTHYADRAALSDAEIAAAAAAGVLQRLGATAQMLSLGEGKSAEETAVIGKQGMFKPATAYLRVAALRKNAAEEIKVALSKMTVEQPLEGMILDLRFANGDSFEDAAAVAGLFLARSKPLFVLENTNLGQKERFENTRDPLFPQTPLVVLINGETRGAVEALAATLQLHKRALLIGRASAAQCFATSDLPLDDGKLLRLATRKVALKEGETLWARPVEPEIAVRVALEEERGMVFGTAPKREKKPAPVTSVFPRSEAELLSAYESPAEPRPARPATTLEEQTDDPVLQRALDVLSAWRMFQPSSKAAASGPSAAP